MPRLVRGRHLAATLAAATFLAALASLAPGSPTVSSCAGAGSHHAALVVEHADGSVVTRCVAFDTNSVSGERLLDLSGIAWSTQTFGGFGDAVCALDSEPAHYSACPGKDAYWAVFVARGGGTWQLTNVGISSLTVGDGDAEGFRYVPASGTPAAPVSPAGVCAGAAASVGATVRPATARPQPATAGPTVITSVPDATATPPGPDAASAGPSPDTKPTATPAGLAVAAGPAQSRDDPAPKPASGFDFGLLVAAVVGGGLAGLATLRLLSGRHSSR